MLGEGLPTFAEFAAAAATPAANQLNDKRGMPMEVDDVTLNGFLDSPSGGLNSSSSLRSGPDLTSPPNLNDDDSSSSSSSSSDSSSSSSSSDDDSSSSSSDEEEDKHDGKNISSSVATTSTDWTAECKGVVSQGCGQNGPFSSYPMVDGGVTGVSVSVGALNLNSTVEDHVNSTIITSNPVLDRMLFYNPEAKGKVRAFGTVINKVVVKKSADQNSKRGRGRPPKAKKLKMKTKDAKPSYLKTPVTRCQEGSERELRKRNINCIMNEEYLFALQEQEMSKEAEVRRTKMNRVSAISNTSAEDEGEVRVPKKKKRTVKYLDGGKEVMGPVTFLRPSGKTLDWDIYLNTLLPANLERVAHVEKFVHAPLVENWSDFAKIGLRMEVPNPHVLSSRPVNWVATTRYFAGYKALIQFESFHYGLPLFAWMSFCSNVPQPIGFSERNDILVFPPPSIAEANENYSELLKTIVEDESCLTIRSDHWELVQSAITTQEKYKMHDIVEVIDYEQRHHRRLAKITGIIADRVHVTYSKTPKKEDKRDSGFWVSVNSDLIHPLGFCETIGIQLFGLTNNVRFPQLDSATLPQFPEEMVFTTGMMFELVHPWAPYMIVVGQIESVYNFGYIMVRIQCKNIFHSNVAFLLHITSPSILPCGFGTRHRVQLIAPADYEGDIDNFDWNEYCEADSKRVKLDLEKLPLRRPNPFRQGDKLEAISSHRPACCSPATVVKIADHLILLHFDGWERDAFAETGILNEAYEWVDYESPNIFPCGWAEMTGHEFHGHAYDPRVEDRNVRLTIVGQQG